MLLGSYELLDEIGRGGLGAVYRARAADGRIVAVKRLLRPDASGALERFERERRLLAAAGEGFVPVLDAGRSPQGPYLVMPFLEGGTLRDRLSRQGKLGAEETLALGRALAEALGRAHAKAIVHRDLKPENVLFDAAGRPWIADLGLAKHFAASSDGSVSVSLSKTGEIRGTVGYMPPEQMQDAKHAGPPADVFSLGAILHECLSGGRAFEGETPLAVISNMDRGEVRPLEAREAPRFLIEAILRALDADPAERFPDGAAFADALTPHERGGSSRWLLLAVTLLLGGAAATWFAASGRPSGPPPTTGPAPIATGSSPSRQPSPARQLSLANVLAPTAWKSALGPPQPFAFTRSAETVLVASGETAILFSVETGEDLAILPAHGAPVSAVAVSPDGRLAATGTRPHNRRDLVEFPSRTASAVRVFDLPGGKLRHTIDLRGAGVSAIAFAGQRIFVGRFNGEIDSFTLEGEDRRREHSSGSGPCGGIAVAEQTGRVFAAVGVSVLELGGGVPPSSFSTPRDISAIAVSAQGSTIATGHREGGLRVWSIATRKVIAAVHAHEPAAQGSQPAVPSVALSPDSRQVVTAGQDGKVKLWDLERMSQEAPSLVRELAAPPVVRWGAACVAFASHGKTIGVRAWDSEVRLFDAKTGAERGTRRPGHGDVVLALALSPDGKTLLSGGRDNALREWDAETGAFRATVSATGEIWSLGWIPGEEAYFSVGYDLRVWDARTRKSMSRSFKEGSAIISAALLAEGRSFLAGCHRGALLGGALEGPGPSRELAGHFPFTRHLAVRGASFYAGSDGRKAAVRDVETGAVRCTLEANASPVDDLVLSGDGRRAVGASGRRLLVWDIPERLPLVLSARELDAEETIVGLAVTAAGELAATGGRDGSIRLWNLRAGAMDGRIDLPGDEAWALLFDPPGKRLWAGTSRGGILRFDVR